MSPMMLLQDYLQHAIVLAAAMTLPAAEVAVLAISLRFISLIRFGVLSVNMAASPLIARAIAAGDVVRRDARLRSAALLKAPAAMLASAAVIVLSGPIMTLFGPEYSGKGGVLACFTLIPLIAAVLGPNHMLLNISGKRSAVFAISLAALAVLFVAVPAAASAFGVAGAAAAATLSYALWETALYLAVRVKLGMDASILSIFKTVQP
jgi:O-antigen/teichoic acid export membrane protein